MKILHVSAMALAAAAGCAIGCGSSGGCSGTNLNQNSNTPVITCGVGTTNVNGVCVPTGTNSGGSTNSGVKAN
jgi:hypothetical protein